MDERQPPARKRKDPKPKSRIALTEGLLIAVASASAYGFAFGYEQGYTSFFKIPPAMISLNVVTIITTAVILCVSLLFVASFMNFSRLFSALSARSVVYLLLAAFMLVLVINYGLSNWFYWIVPVVIALIIVGLEYTAPDDKKFMALLNAISKRFGPLPILVACYFVLGYLLASGLGKAQAVNDTDFLVTNTNMVVLRQYGDNLIAAPFDQTTKEVQPIFTILKLGDPTIALNLEAVGPLHIGALITPTAPSPTPTLMPSPSVTPTLTPMPTLTPVATQ